LNGKVAAPGLENRDYGRGNPLRWQRGTLYPQKLALTSPPCGGRSVGMVRLWTKTTEFVFCLIDRLDSPLKIVSTSEEHVGSIFTVEE
jgi:hypothetical protein